MKAAYTRISENNMTQIAGRQMTPKEMVAFLKEGALFRNFSDVLRKAYPGEDLAVRLTEGLVGITGRDRESVSRRVRNWLNGSNVPKNREQLFQICFALGLDESAAGSLIGSADETSIHYRNPVELVYAFALRTGRSYEEALELKEQMLPIYYAGRNKDSVQALRYTQQIRDEFASVGTVGELEQFFVSFSCDLGEIHETAYRKFIRLLEELQEPEDEVSDRLGEDEKERRNERYTVEQVMEKYLRMHVPNTKRTAGFSYLQKVIKKNWPSESEIIRMKGRKMDVSRKALLLLFLVTEDFEYSDELDGEEKDLDLYYEELMGDADERLEARLGRIDLFLENYGMNLLDPGNPFDCLVLYALRAQYGDEGEGISGSFKAALETLFGGRESDSLMEDGASRGRESGSLTEDETDRDRESGSLTEDNAESAWEFDH